MTTAQLTTGQTEIHSDWQLSIDVDLVLRGQGADPAKIRVRQPRLVALAERAIVEGNSWIRPQVAYRLLEILDVLTGRVILANGAELKGFGAARKLRGSKSVIAAIATLGPELGREIESAMKDDAAFALSLDGFGTAAIGGLTTAARQFFALMVGGGPGSISTPLYPGMRGWDLAPAQTQIFSIVDGQSIGVTLNPSFMMTPFKSMSMLFGFGIKAQPVTQPCDECGASATCRHKPPTS